MFPKVWHNYGAIKAFPDAHFSRCPPKPEWVRKKIIRLKALMLGSGCRTIAHAFNRLHARKDMTVGKSYVNEVVRKHRYEIQMLRRRIKHKRTEVACPWQNGKVERFFGTLKERLNQWEVASFEELTYSLHLFRFWYNHVRPHDYLDGATPTEVWQGRKGNPDRAQWFEAWEGLLNGYWLPP